MTRVLLHIGGEKTGSTYLQHWLHRNAHRLLRHGVFYPTARPLCIRRAHFPLAAALLPPHARDFLPCNDADMAEPLFAELRRETRRSGAHTLLLSAEHFASRLDVAALWRLRRLLGATGEVQVLMYARWQDEVALSLFGTALRSGERGEFQPDRIGPHQRVYNPWRVACDWMSVFGETQLRVHGYAEAAHAGLASDLLAATGLPQDSGWQHVQRANERLDRNEADLLRLLNRYLPTWGEALLAGAPERHRRAIRLRDLALHHYRARYRGAGAPLASLLGPTERERILARFAGDNESLTRRFAVTPAPPPATATGSAAAPVPLSQHTLAHRLERVLYDAGLLLAGDRIVARRPAALYRLGAAVRRHLAKSRTRHGPLTGISALSGMLTAWACGGY